MKTRETWWSVEPGERCWFCGQIAGIANVLSGQPRNRVFDEDVRRMKAAAGIATVCSGHPWNRVFDEAVRRMKAPERERASLNRQLAELTAKKVPKHLQACGTQYRGCAPGCPFDAVHGDRTE